MNLNNISEVSASLLCSNCGACAAVCPTDAISFKFTSIGRLPAIVNEKLCISCKKCRKVCPSLDIQNTHSAFEDPFVGPLKEVYVGRCSDNKLFLNAQSGGVCSATIKYLFESKKIDAALVCSMEFGNPPVVTPIIITSPQDLEKTQKSCYTPVSLLSVLKKIKDYQSVALVGIPCHIEGVESLNRLNQFKNIKYRLGLICDRTLCNTLQDVFTGLSGLGPEYKITWRHKLFQNGNITYSYNNAPVTVTDSMNHCKVLPNTYRFLLKDMFTPPRCWVCYDKINVFADVVFGDPWRIPDVNEKEGDSLIATRTELGSLLIKEMINKNLLRLQLRPNEQLLQSQQIKERRKQVAIFSKAIRILPEKCESYLYNQSQEKNISQKELNGSEKKILSFIKNDAKSKHLIIKEAVNLIRKHQIRRKLHIEGLKTRICRLLKN